MSKFWRRTVTLCLVGMALGACASRQAHQASAPDPSRPSYGSIYYYTVASYLRAGHNYSAADELYRRALASDPRSPRLRKQVLLNALDLHQTGGIETEEMRSLIAEYATQIQSDEELLYGSYGFYEQVADSTALENTIRDIQKRFPSSRAYIQRFIHDLRHRDITNTKNLDSALKLAHNDPQSLLMLAKIYSFYAQDKEKQALLRFHEIAPSEESHALLRDHIIRTGNLDLARDYFSSLEYPAEREYMQSFAEASIAPERYGLLSELAPQILATQDLDLLNMLGLSAMLSRREDVLASIKEILRGSNAPDRDKQYLSTMLIAHSIASGDQDGLDAWVDKLFEASYFDDILAHYNFAIKSDLTVDWRSPDPEALEAFKRQIGLRLEDGPPSRYLISIASAVQDSTDKSFVDARHDLLIWLKQRHGLSSDDYEYLLQYYYNQGRLAERRALMEEALREYPDNPLFCNDMGYYLLSEGTAPEEAAILIRRALAVDPENPYYLDSLAWYHYLIGDYQQALELSAIPQEMENIPAEIAWHIGAIYLKLEDFTNARLWLERCIGIGGDPENAAKAEAALKQIP